MSLFPSTAASAGSLAPLILFAVVATGTPGGATALATASGSRFGFRRSIPLMTGIALGLATLTAAAAVGLAGLLLAVPALQTAMRVIGSVYLLWLAWKVARSGPPDFARSERAVEAPTTLVGGACLLWLNPKGWAVALGAAASFAMLADGPLRLALLLAATFGGAALLSMSLWCAAGVLLARLLRTPLQWRIVNAILGVLLAVSIITMWR